MIYANHAATSWPKSPFVIQAVTDSLAECPREAERSGGTCIRDIREECRQALADLFNAPEPKRIVLTSGATHALNLVIEGLLRNAAHVVTSMTEHNSVLRPLHRISKESGLEVSYVPCDNDGRINPNKIIEIMRRDTRAVILNHASNVTGIVQDIHPIAAVCRERGIVLIVDASQSAGCVPIDVQTEMIDVLAFAGHKGLGSPPGTGGAVLATDVELRPLMIGGTGIRSDLEDHPWDYPLRYEAGTPNICGLAGLTRAVRECLDEGISARRSHLFGLTESLVDALSEIKGLRLIAGSSTTRLPVQSILVDGMNVSDLGYVLQESFGIVCRAGLHCAPKIHSCLGTAPEGTLRLSLGRTSTQGDIDGITDALREICTSLRNR